MKRIISALGLCLVLSIQLMAHPVDAKSAKAFAKQFINVDEEDLRSAQFNEQKHQDAYYIFNAQADKGFVIVSGEDRLPLLVGYADKGHLDKKHLPIQLKALLARYAERVKAVRQGPEDNLRSQQVFMHKPKAKVAPLIKALWGQDLPFNDDAPEIHDGVRAVSGCVATAMAQIMYYHKWPKQGKGAHSYTPKAYGKNLLVDFSESFYQWDKMRDEYKIKRHQKVNGEIEIIKEYNEEEAKAVAKLVYDLGVSVSMQFNTDANGGSSASTYTMAKSLNRYFDYSSKYIHRAYTAHNRFMEVIKRELEAHHPLMLSGGESNIGHAWVVDGYDENDYLHCNWGWRGIANGFYSLDFMVPADTGIGSGLGRYNDDQGIVIAVPNKAGANHTISNIRNLAFSDDGKLAYTGSTGERIAYNLAFKATNFGNFDFKKFRGSLALGIYKQNGDFIEAQDIFNQIFLTAGRYYQEFTRSLSLSNYNAGHYQVRLICKEQGQQDWQVIEAGNTLKFEIRSGRFYITDDDNELKFRHSQAPRELTTAYTKSKGSTSLEIENLSNQIIEGKIKMKLHSQADLGDHTINLPSVKLYRFSKKSINITYDLSRLSGLKAGTYDLSFELEVLEAGQYRGKTIENPFGTYSIKVLDADNMPRLSVKSLECKQGGEELSSYHITKESIKKGALQIQAVLANKGALTFKGKLNFSLKKLSDGSFTELGTSKEIELYGGQESSANACSVEIDLKELELEDGAYQLCISAEHNGESFDIWNTELRRYNFLWEKDKTTALIEQLTQSKVKIYPNPVAKELHIQGVYRELAIYSMQGERVLYLAPKQGGTSQTLDLSSLAKGLYILRLHQGNSWQSLRLYKR